MRKVKAIDIARELGISKASVSLALNNKPGVSEQKKAEILECKKRLEENLKNGIVASPKVLSPNPDSSKMKRIGKTIKLVMMNRAEIASWEKESELQVDFHLQSMATFANEIRDMGYTVGLSYESTEAQSFAHFIDECNQDEVAGVIIHATALRPDQAVLFEQIHKPVIIYDCDANARYHSVTIDNHDAVFKAMDYLTENGHSEIVYVAHALSIYNFEERRKCFRNYCLIHGLPYDDNSIVTLGIDQKASFLAFRDYLKDHPLPKAILAENYQMSLGVMRVLLESGVKIPEEVSVVGIDEVSSFYFNGYHLTQIKISHSDRAAMAVMLLKREMEKEFGTKCRLKTPCKLIEGDTVLKKN